MQVLEVCHLAFKQYVPVFRYDIQAVKNLRKQAILEDSRTFFG